MSTGRPPAFNRAFIDCKFPRDEELPTTLEPGDPSSCKAFFTSFVLLLLILELVHTWDFRFAYEGLAEIIARTLTATPLRYSTIKELDRKIHELGFPPQALEALCGGPGVDPRSLPLPTSMLAFLISNLQDIGELMFPFGVPAARLRNALSPPFPSSQLLCSGSDRRPRKPIKKPICSVILSDCPSI